MAALTVSALLLTLVTQGWTAPLEVFVDGLEFTGTEFCVGDNIIFNCDIPSNSHHWTFAGSQLSRTRLDNLPHKVGPDNRFTLALAQPLPNDSIISTLSVSAYSEFDAVSITCSDGNGMITDLQTSTATILGPPSAPEISLIARADFQSFNVTLSTAGSSARCVLQYSLTITENEEPLTPKTIGSNGTGSVGGLNLCKNTYTFSAVAMTKDMNSSSGSVPGPVNFSAVSELSSVRVNNGLVEWTISSSLPGECYGSYSLQLSRCMIQGFATLPTISDVAGGAVVAVTADATFPASMAPVNLTSYESVDINNCVRPTLRTSITPADISGRLVLSSASTEASSSLCNISLMAQGVASTNSLFSCTDQKTTVTDVTTTGSGGGGGGGSSAPVIGGVVGGIVVVVILILIVIVIVVLLCKRASKHEVKGQRLHPTPATGGPAVGEHGDGGTPRDMRYEAAQIGDIQYDTVGGQPGHGDGPGDMQYDTVGGQPGHGDGPGDMQYDTVGGQPGHGDGPGDMQYDTVGGQPGHGDGPGDMQYDTVGGQPGHGDGPGDMQYDTVGGQPGHGDGPGDMRYVTAGNEPGRGAGTEYDAVIHGDQPNGHPDDNLPTYQDPDTIKRQAGGDGGAIYTLVDKTDGKKKSVKKNGSAPMDEIPLYSMPDKSKKQHDPGLVNANIDVKKPAVSSRSCPPPPQGFATEQDANGPVICSSVQLL